MILPTLAFMAPAQGGSAGGGFAVLLFQIAAIGLVFYFLIIRPQSAARKKHAQVLAGLKPGDEIVTAGGIMGRVKNIKDDRVTVESGTSTLVVHRARIVQVGATEAAPPGAA